VCASTGNATLLLLLLLLLSRAQPHCRVQVWALPQVHGCMSRLRTAAAMRACSICVMCVPVEVVLALSC
jgi:hypothetical protein